MSKMIFRILKPEYVEVGDIYFYRTGILDSYKSTIVTNVEKDCFSFEGHGCAGKAYFNNMQGVLLKERGGLVELLMDERTLKILESLKKKVQQK